MNNVGGNFGRLLPALRVIFERSVIEERHYGYSLAARAAASGARRSYGFDPAEAGSCACPRACCIFLTALYTHAASVHFVESDTTA
jgi:hypothetical protein